ncbi:hypothetical protein GGR17_002342 [Confluentimicrobium naphthalenivorans]|uniref:Uncharacterized protein n=1 Tax=Actibacterium naphthalenivorans TaxID=1614693 RepID=A0A840CCF3_9RHOB|nr:hypothetical protein [Actibacterium naphthalenivorans]
MKDTIGALAKRIEHSQQVGSELEAVFDEFLSSSSGQGYSWDSRYVPVQFGSTFGRIVSKDLPTQEDRCTFDLQISSHGEITSDIGSWAVEEGTWVEQSTEHLAVEFETHEEPSDIAAKLIAKIISLNSQELSIDLRNHIEAKMADELYLTPNPEPV